MAATIYEIRCDLCGEIVGAYFGGQPIPDIYHLPCAQRERENDEALAQAEAQDASE